MSNEILGTDFRYIVDVSYGINQDGFIAIGTESIVYKGIKVAQSGDLEFSCVLKFKPKHSYLNGEYKDKVKKFKEDEFSIFEELKECRSVVKIFDVIEDMGSFSLKCDKINSGIITGENYFCVVEEYIDGWSLEEYCRSEFWKLRKYEETGNGLKKVIEYHDFRDDEKENLEVNSLSADTADRLCRVYLFLVAIELCPLSSVMVGAQVRLRHAPTSCLGYKNSTCEGHLSP